MRGARPARLFAMRKADEAWPPVLLRYSTKVWMRYAIVLVVRRVHGVVTVFGRPDTKGRG